MISPQWPRRGPKIALLLVSAALFSTVPLFSGTLTDKANILGPQGKEVNASLANLPVFVETFISAPDLKEYADNRVRELTDRGFLIAITTQPRAWRISATPGGIASSEAIRLVGDRMTDEFRAGHFGYAVLQAAKELNQLTVAAPVSRPSVVMALPPEPARPNAYKKEDDYFWLWFAGGGFVILCITGLSIAISKSRKRERERQERIQQEREERSANIAERNRVRHMTRRDRTSTIAPPPNTARPSREAAQEYYDSYPRAVREVYVQQYSGHPAYSSGVLSDPIMFWMFMNTVTNNNNISSSHCAAQAAAAPAPASVARELTYTPPSTRQNDNDDSWRRSSSPTVSTDPSPSVSDFGGGSGGFGGSSSSSSDSGGAGGGW